MYTLSSLALAFNNLSYVVTVITVGVGALLGVLMSALELHMARNADKT